MQKLLIVKAVCQTHRSLRRKLFGAALCQ